MLKKVSLIIAVILYTLSSISYADIQDGLLLTGVKFSNEIYAGEKVGFIVGVLEVKAKNGMGQLENFKPSTNAKVQLKAVSGSQIINVPLIHVKEGEYRGKIIFPSSGEWKITAIAETEGEQPYKKQEHSDEEQNMLQQTIVVQQAKDIPIYVLIGVIVTLFLATIYILEKLIN